MIHWLTLLPACLASGLLGFAACAIFAAGKVTRLEAELWDARDELQRLRDHEKEGC